MGACCSYSPLAFSIPSHNILALFTVQQLHSPSYVQRYPVKYVQWGMDCNLLLWRQWIHVKQIALDTTISHLLTTSRHMIETIIPVKTEQWRKHWWISREKPSSYPLFTMMVLWERGRVSSGCSILWDDHKKAVNRLLCRGFIAYFK